MASNIDIENAYISAATAHLELLLEHDVKGSNRAHDQVIENARKIRNWTDRGQEMLERLLLHPHDNVRCWAAVHLLPLDEERALETLHELKGHAKHWQTSLDAETAIEEWKAGNLDPDWFVKK